MESNTNNWLTSARYLVDHMRRAAEANGVDNPDGWLEWCQQIEDLSDAELLAWQQSDSPMYDLVPPPEGHVGNA